MRSILKILKKIALPCGASLTNRRLFIKHRDPVQSVMKILKPARSILKTLLIVHSKSRSRAEQSIFGIWSVFHYIHTNIHACMHTHFTYIHTYIHTYTHAYIHGIHFYRYICINVYMYICLPALLFQKMRTLQGFEVPRFEPWFWSCFVGPGTCSFGTHKLGSPKTS